MQITLPENLSNRLRQLAARRQKSVEHIVADRLFTSLDEELDQLPTTEQVELRALHHLSDDALQAIAAEKLDRTNQTLMNQLMQKNSKGLLTSSEHETLAQLVERGERLMLRKAEAVAILSNRKQQETPKQ